MFNWVVKMPLKLKIKTPEQCHSCCSGAFIVDLTHFPHWFSCMFFISHTYFTYCCFIVDSKQVSAVWQGFQKSKYING